MPMQEPVTPQQAKEIIKPAALRLTPAALTCRLDETWQAYRSRFLGLQQEQLLLEYGQAQAGQPKPQFATAQKLGVAFKWHNRKYIFSATISDIRGLELANEGRVKAMFVQWPQEVFRLQRRAFIRVKVPASQFVRARMWDGGLVAMERGLDDHEEIYLAHVLDLSAGGFSAHNFTRARAISDGRRNGGKPSIGRLQRGAGDGLPVPAL